MTTNGQTNMSYAAKAEAAGLDWLLDDLTTRLNGAEQAVVLSADGLLIGRSSSLDRERAEHLSAMASAFRSLARSVGTTFNKGVVHQTVIELERGYLVVTEAGEGACLALLASAKADLGMVAYEMNVIVQQVGPAFSAKPRAAVESPGPHTP